MGASYHSAIILVNSVVYKFYNFIFVPKPLGSTVETVNTTVIVSKLFMHSRFQLESLPTFGEGVASKLKNIKWCGSFQLFETCR